MSHRRPEGSDADRTDSPIVRVECYAGHRGDETPRAVIIGDRRVEVVEVLDRWIAPDHRYFKIKGDDGDIYIVRYANPSDWWELTMFRAGGSDRLRQGHGGQEAPPLRATRPRTAECSEDSGD